MQKAPLPPAGTPVGGEPRGSYKRAGVCQIRACRRPKKTREARRLGFWSAVAVLVGSTIGGGIFRTPAVIAERVPSPLPMFSVWVLGGLLALCGALTYAELAALFPRSGGVYVYIREGFGRLPA